MFTDYLKQLCIGTAAEPIARRGRTTLNTFRAVVDPFMRAVLVEEPRAVHALLARELRPDTNCVDVGAHLGETTQQFVRYAPYGHHLSVEPTPYKARWLRRTFPDVEIAEVALAASSGTSPFFHHPKASGYSGLRLHLGGGAHAESAHQLTVRTMRLDDLIPATRRVGFLKVDTEGAEAEVFRGATRILEHDRPLILFECTQSATKAFDTSPGELFDILSGYGYALRTPQAFTAASSALDRSGFEACTRYPFQSFNFVASPLDLRA